MERNPDPKLLQQALHMASTPAGKKLLALIKEQNQEKVSQARQQAAQGNYEQAKQTLSDVLNRPDIQQLIQQMRDQDG